MRIAFASVVAFCVVIQVTAQTPLPEFEKLWIVPAQSYRQPDTKAPFDLTLRSGTKVTVTAQDISEGATGSLREYLHDQQPRPMDPTLLFVLHIQGIAPVSKTHSAVTLLSGAVLRIPSSDIPVEPRLSSLRTALVQAIYASKTPKPSPSAQSENAVASGNAVIRAKCATDWPDDFAMRAHCQKRQDDGVTALQGRNMTGTSDRVTIRTKCATDWPDDFAMRDYCEGRQLEALKVIR